MRNFSVYTTITTITSMALLATGGYFYSNGYSDELKIKQTINDVKFMVNNINERYKGVYKNFDNRSVVYDGILPLDIVTKETSLGINIKNRFNGQLYVFESFKTKRERGIYLGLYKQGPEKYKSLYEGVGSYIIYLTNLRAVECKNLAITDWKRVTPNFFGIEAAALMNESRNNGVYNLQYYLLIDNIGEEYKSMDTSKIYRRSLTKEQADEMCNCLWHNCTIALKFL